MNDNIVGVLAAATRDHILLDGLPLHITLCDKNPNGGVICEVKGNMSLDDVMKVWDQSTRQCSWCAKKLAKRQRE